MQFYVIFSIHQVKFCINNKVRYVQNQKDFNLDQVFSDIGFGVSYSLEASSNLDYLPL